MTPPPAPALQGALLAFQRGHSPSGRSDGRLTPGASTSPSREPSPMRLAPHGTGPRGRRTSPARTDVSDSTRRLSPARTADSFIAANLAVGTTARTGSPVRAGAADTGAVRGTTSLISMFEGTESGRSMGRGAALDGDPVKPRTPRPRAKTPAGPRDGPAAAPTPSGKPSVKPKLKPGADAALLAARQVSAPPSDTRETPQRARSARPPTPPKPRASRARTASPVSSGAERGRPVAPGTARATRRQSASSEDTFVSASSGRHPSPPPPRVARTPSKSASTSPVRRPVPPPRRNHVALDATALSSAITAGSLASSRLTPSNTGDAPARPLHSPRMLPTLRTGDGAQDADEEGRGKRHGHGHGHAHGHRHRKKQGRWEGRILEAQRKRYEALWASNRGVLDEHGSGDPARGDGYVVNVVVRELWRRSRLPDDELEEVWALVDRERRGVLGRSEFVVGTWLVDQRLRGRKIPARVGEGVWDSARGVRGR